MTLVLDKFRTLLPSKLKTSPSGWISFNAPSVSIEVMHTTLESVAVLLLQTVLSIIVSIANILQVGNPAPQSLLNLKVFVNG